MGLACPYCRRENDDLALVCATCSRDIAIPDALVTERLDLIAKRDATRAELSRTQAAIAALRAKRSSRSG